MSSKTLPKGQRIVLTYVSKSGTFLITTDAIRSTYTLFAQENNGYTKLGTGKDPTKLESKIKSIEKG